MKKYIFATLFVFFSCHLYSNTNTITTNTNMVITNTMITNNVVITPKAFHDIDICGTPEAAIKTLSKIYKYNGKIFSDNVSIHEFYGDMLDMSCTIELTVTNKHIQTITFSLSPTSSNQVIYLYDIILSSMKKEYGESSEIRNLYAPYSYEDVNRFWVAVCLGKYVVKDVWKRGFVTIEMSITKDPEIKILFYNETIYTD